jgi:thiosulfate/3-mercaptopyruvate sulfurtransferase
MVSTRSFTRPLSHGECYLAGPTGQNCARMRQTRPVSYLIAPLALQDKLRTITVLDARWRLGGPPARSDFDAGHVPGAAFLDLETDVCGAPGIGGRHPLPDPGELQRALRAAGVRADRPVVVYDDGDGVPAARVWWTLRWAGHRDVRVLDGGYAAWIAAGLGEIESGPGGTAPGDFTVDPGHAAVVDADEAAAAARTGVLIDARQAPRYRGETEPIDPVAGHVPGARNVPHADLVEADGRLRAADVLRDRFAAAGAKDGTAVAAYCGSGVTAAHAVLALAEAGIEDAALYVGSWSNWITDPSRTIATGEE